MMHRLAIALLLGLTWIAPAKANPIIGDISSHKIEIHSAFTGTQLLLFGARNDAGDIVIIIRGPEQNFIVRKKENVFGMWVNREQYEFQPMPEFYAVATSRDFSRIRDHLLFKPLAIGSAEMVRRNVSLQHDHFASALLRKLQEQQLYSMEPAPITFISETLFRTVIDFPDKLPRGTYTAEIYLIRDGEIAGVQTIPIKVYKTGFDAFIYDLAQNKSPFYGLLAVVIAYMAGWLAFTIFHRLR